VTTRRIAPLALLALLGPAAPGRAGTATLCDQAKRINGWCEAADAGYVASVEIRSRFLYEVLDAHGHDIDPRAVTCETCKKALWTDGYCPAHKMGFVHGEAYLSPLNYHLARTRRVDPSTITCRTCRKHTRGIGWCEKDRVGIAGLFAVDDRQEFKELERAYGILLAAVAMAPRCETCAGAIVTDGYCGIHHVKYVRVARETLTGEENLAARRAAAGGHLDELNRAIDVAEGLRESPQMNAARGGRDAADQNDEADRGP
jgi:hypothetical protein